jgi:hypothetical protein
MFSPETQSEKIPIEVLWQKAREAIASGKNEGDTLAQSAMEALIAWQRAAEKEADVQNTSAANIEVMVTRAQLFIEALRPDLADLDLEDAIEAAENDSSFPEERLREIREMKRNIRLGSSAA